MGPTNLASLVATDASRFFSGNMRALLAHLLEGTDRLNLASSDPIIRALLGAQSVARSSVAAA
jgi:H+-translocating NAD(P) transhydrogenase subunit alpha